MFKTKDGFSVNLRDTVYVIYNRFKVNRLGKRYQSRDNTDVALYRMEIFGMCAQATFDRDNNPIDVYYGDGIAYEVNSLLPDGSVKEDAPFYCNVYASPLNTFATRQAAEADYPEFRRRGLVNTCHSAYFADEPMCNKVIY